MLIKKLTIPRCLGKPKIAKGSLRDIEMILLSGQVSKNLHQQMFVRTHRRSKKCSLRIDNKKLTIPRCLEKSKIAKESLSKISNTKFNVRKNRHATRSKAKSDEDSFRLISEKSGAYFEVTKLLEAIFDWAVSCLISKKI